MNNKNNQRLSILFFGTQMATGGAQRVLLDQANWFYQHGHNVYAAFLYDKDGFQAKWQAVAKFPIINLRAFKTDEDGIINWLYLIKGMFSLWRLLLREKIDVIETFTHDSNILALPVAWLAKVPVRIATHHGMIDGFSIWRQKIHSWLINHQFANVLVAVSERTRLQAIEEGVDSDRIAVIKNGIAPISFEGKTRSNLRKEAGIADNEMFLLSVGRLVYQKAHEILIQSMPQILKKFPNAKLGICGDGILRSELEKQIAQLGVSRSVELLGEWDNVVKFLEMADIFVLPSRWEGMPIALLEAMRAGLPVVATNVEGVDEVVKQSEHGLLVSAENVNELADAILQLMENPQLRIKMGVAGQSHVLAHYTEDIMCQQYLRIMMKFLPADEKAH